MPSAVQLLLFSLLALCHLTQISSFKVFGVAPGRSGTDSQKLALTRLGFGPCMHMKELLGEESGIPTFHMFAMFEAAARGQDIDWVDMLKDFNSGVDYPISSYPEELLAAFPDARFILNIRPSASWYKSLQQSICQVSPERAWYMRILTLPLPFFPFKVFRAQVRMMDSMTAHKFVKDGTSTWGSFCGMDQASVQKVYDDWVDFVKRVVPPSQLLVFRVGEDGYEELAAFLGVEKPDEEYPNVNSSKEFVVILGALQVVAVVTVLGPVAVVALLVRSLMSRKGGKGKSKAN